MEVFVNREPIGCETFDLEDIKELEEQLTSFAPIDTIGLKSEVKVEITGTWEEIRKLLSQPCFDGIWFDPKRSPTAVQYFCDVCGTGEWGHSDRLPKGWMINRKPDGGAIGLCAKCNKCTEENPCCDRRGEYNGFASGPLLFECPKHCSCHD